MGKTIAFLRGKTIQSSTSTCTEGEFLGREMTVVWARLLVETNRTAKRRLYRSKINGDLKL